MKKMAGRMKAITFVLAGVTFLCILFYCITHRGIWETLAITFGTIFYHFCMRLLIGLFYNITMKNHADYRKKCYQLKKWEPALYKKLRVKKWKNKMPTYDEKIFDPQLHTWDEIAQAMCQSELVHKTIVVFSFLPLVTVPWFGAFPVFLITSIAAACCDMLFVIMQRYNRSRILKML